jgi:hypothetical protein
MAILIKNYAFLTKKLRLWFSRKTPFFPRKTFRDNRHNIGPSCVKVSTESAARLTWAAPFLV